jgi:hypothetical protein
MTFKGQQSLLELFGNRGTKHEKRISGLPRPIVRCPCDLAAAAAAEAPSYGVVHHIGGLGVVIAGEMRVAARGSSIGSSNSLLVASSIR